MFLRWTFLRAVCHQGYWLTASLYFVLDARLSASQLVLLGAVMALTLLVSDIPVGVWADARGRRWPLVAGHVVLAAGMVMTGLVTSFPLILMTQVLWGVGWACFNGVDVAWLTDELDQPERVARVLAAGARWGLVGAAVGMVAFGLMGWAVGLAPAVVTTGGAMAALGLFFSVRFVEPNFVPAGERRWAPAIATLRRGLDVSRHDRQILVVFVATAVVNGAGEVSRLFPRRLIDLGFPSDPVLWYTALGIVALGGGALALRIVEARIDGAHVARRAYVFGCAVGAAGLFVLAVAPAALIGSAGVVLVTGIAFNVTRVVSVIWVNRRVTRDVRATVQSFLSQAESAGEIVGGVALAAVAGASGAPAALVAAAALFVFAGYAVYAWATA